MLKPKFENEKENYLSGWILPHYIAQSGIYQFSVQWICTAVNRPDGKLVKVFFPESTAQCARTDLNKRFLPKPMTTTG